VARGGEPAGARGAVATRAESAGAQPADASTPASAPSTGGSSDDDTQRRQVEAFLKGESKARRTREAEEAQPARPGRQTPMNVPS
jgi:hypothetical protein